MTELSVIIVSYNARADLVRCLTSLGDHPPSVPYEVVVVDNASTDGSAAAARCHAGVRVIDAGANLGFATANNRGIRETTGELILLLNSDTIVPAGALDRLVDTLRRRPDVGIVGPRLVDGDGRAELSFGAMISPLAEWRQRGLVRGRDRGKPGAQARVDEMTRTECYPDWVSGACLIVRREDAVAAGLLDERYFLYTEDVDFCAAVRSLGKHVLFTPAIEVVHVRGRSAAAAPGAARAAYLRSHLAFYEKHHPRLAPLLRIYRRIVG